VWRSGESRAELQDATVLSLSRNDWKGCSR
jgi:hypothetical protein